MFDILYEKRYAVFGNPILHSLSPVIFNAAFKINLSNSIYLRILCRKPSEILWFAKEFELDGFNITAPFKESFIPYLNSLSADAQKIGAVNTVVKKNNKYVGYNTDWIGVIDALKKRGCKLKGSKCIILGAGGAARAAIYGLTKERVNICVVNRTFNKAGELSKIFGCKYDKFERLNELLRGCDILISTIPQNVNLIDRKSISKDITIFDANYKGTELKKMVAGNRVKFIDGREWLLYQALAAFKLFTGECVDEEPIRKILYRKVRNYPHNLALTGFMGSGKTTVAGELTKISGFKQVDTDTNIENKTHLKIPKIFKKRGEKYFRRLEREELCKMKFTKKCIYSPGGGIILSGANRRLLKRNGITIWLYSSATRCYKRIKGGTRPLLNLPRPLFHIKRLLSNRLFFYSQSADIVISNNYSSIRETAKIIYDEIDKTITGFWKP